MTINCAACDEPLPQQHLSFDQRVEFHSPGQCNILDDTCLILLCGHACWKVCEADLAAMLKLKETYPSVSQITNCCRCGRQIDRKKPYVAYAITEICVDYTASEPMADMIDDTEFAVLCSHCEEPSVTRTAAEASQREEVTT
jgi:hypothetical protein